MRVFLTQAGFCPECGLEVANSANPKAVGERVTKHRNDFHDSEHRLLETCGVFPLPEELPIGPTSAASRRAQRNIRVNFGERKRVLQSGRTPTAAPSVQQQNENQLQQQAPARQQFHSCRGQVTNESLHLPFPANVPCGYGLRSKLYYCPFARCRSQCASLENLATHIAEMHPYEFYCRGQLNLCFLDPPNSHYVTLTERGVCPECGLDFNSPTVCSKEH
ncbi:hypothetical protein BGX38DRAFT_1205074 [Terfezia claveryi]|nr:hypothetical protein BGX38DRAFT_1205074 [Terfezia claveryi]